MEFGLKSYLILSYLASAHTHLHAYNYYIYCFVFLAYRQIYDNVAWETTTVYTQDQVEVAADFAHMLSCDGIWTLFLRRISNAVNFTLNWDNYVEGFGNIDENFWLGLENIHQGTSVRGSNVLKIYLESFDDGI